MMLMWGLCHPTSAPPVQGAEKTCRLWLLAHADLYLFAPLPSRRICPCPGKAAGEPWGDMRWAGRPFSSQGWGARQARAGPGALVSSSAPSWQAAATRPFPPLPSLPPPSSARCGFSLRPAHSLPAPPPLPHLPPCRHRRVMSDSLWTALSNFSMPSFPGGSMFRRTKR